MRFWNYRKRPCGGATTNRPISFLISAPVCVDFDIVPSSIDLVGVGLHLVHHSASDHNCGGYDHRFGVDKIIAARKIVFDPELVKAVYLDNGAAFAGFKHEYLVCYAFAVYRMISFDHSACLGVGQIETHRISGDESLSACAALYDLAALIDLHILRH